jgi:ribosome-binding factor A
VKTLRRRRDVPGQRQLRVGEELRHAVVHIFTRAHFRDPILAGLHVTVTEVRVSPDLRNATAFVVPFGGGDAEALVAALNRAGGFVRAQLAHEVKLRYTPSIRFAIDSAFDNAGRIDQLLHDPRVARDVADSDTEPAAEEQEAGGRNGR